MDPQIEALKREVAELRNQLQTLEEKYNWHRHLGSDYSQRLEGVVFDYFVLRNLSANPALTTAGALAAISGKLKIYDGSAWTIVGTQS